MATNMVRDEGKTLKVAKASVEAGDPVVFGQIPGVALTDTDADGNIVMQTRGVFELAVVGADGDGNAAVTAGAIVYLDSAAVNVDSANGVRFGYALSAVSSGATTTINVLVGY